MCQAEHGSRLLGGHLTLPGAKRLIEALLLRHRLTQPTLPPEAPHGQWPYQ